MCPKNSTSSAAMHAASSSDLLVIGRTMSPLDPFCFSPDYSLLRDRRLQELLNNRTVDVLQAQEILRDEIVANRLEALNCAIWGFLSNTVSDEAETIFKQAGIL